MNAKERVLTAFAHQEPDRVPVNYLANSGIDQRLKEHFGLASDDSEGLRQCLGVDFRHVWPPYVGPKLHEDIPERGIKVDRWGIHRRWVEHGSGGYWDFCDFPLRDADEETVANWPMPDPDLFDYSVIPAQCKEHKGYAMCFMVHGDLINENGMLRGMDQALMDLVVDDPAGLLLASRRLAIELEMIRRVLEAGNGSIDILWIGEDLGTQDRPMVSPEIFEKHILPRKEKLVNLAKAYEAKVMIHCCGSSSWAFEDFIRIGIDAADTLQPEAKDMAPAYLKKTYGGRLAFHGSISTAGPVSFGTVAEVDEYCRNTLQIMMPGGGYCLGTGNSVANYIPVDNYLAMLDEGRRYAG